MKVGISVYSDGQLIEWEKQNEDKRNERRFYHKRDAGNAKEFAR